MIIKITPELEGPDSRSYLYDCNTLSIAETQAESWGKGRKDYVDCISSGLIGIEGRRHPKIPEDAKQPIMILALDAESTGCKKIFLLGHVHVYVMNEQGKTVDSYHN